MTSADKDLTDRLRRIESALYAIAQSQDKLMALLTEEAEGVEVSEVDLEGNPSGSERDPKDSLS